MADNITENTQSTPTEQPTHSRWNFLKTMGSKFGRRTEGHKQQPQTESSALVKTAREQLIDKVLSEGLLSSATIQNQGGKFLGSIDNKPLSVVMGRALKPKREYRDEKHFQNAIAQALYWGSNSCLPVVTERPGEGSEERLLFRSTQAERDRISERVFASFLVVTKSEPDIYYFDKDEGQTKPQDFVALIFPEQVLREYDPDSTRIKNQNVKSVTRTVSRSLEMGDPIPMPDYEGAIREVIQELDSPIWIHAVRLPVSSDLTQSPTPKVEPQTTL